MGTRTAETRRRMHPCTDGARGQRAQLGDVLSGLRGDRGATAGPTPHLGVRPPGNGDQPPWETCAARLH
jgi:hypothetical protein